MAKFDFKGMLTSQAVLYVTLFFAVFSLIGYLIVGNLDAVLFFVLTGFITSFFSKNMIVVLLVALLATNFIWSGVFKMRREGLENKSDSEKEKDKKKDASDKKLVEADESSLNVGASSKQPQLNKTDMSMGKNMPIQDKNKLPMKMDQELFKGDDDDMKAKSSIASKGGYKGGAKASPSSVEHDDSTPKIDHAATVEAAYDNIQKALGSDGVQKLTQDTKALLDKQEKLQESLQNLTPLFEQAQNVLTNFDMSKINNILGNLDMSQFSKVFSQFGLAPPVDEKDKK